MAAVARLRGVIADDAKVGVAIFRYGTGVIFGLVTVHDYTILYFNPCYHVTLEQNFKYGISHIRFSVSCD